MKKITAFILLLVMLSAAVFTGCSDKGKVDEKDSSTTRVTTVTDDNNEGMFKTIRDDLPDTMDFGGKTVRMIVRSNERFYSEFNTESYSSSVLGDALYERVLNVEDRLNINVEICPDSNASHGPWEDISTQILSGTCDYHVAAGSSYKAANFAINGQYRNLRNIDNLNLNKEYWAQGMIDNLTVADTTFFATGSISTYFCDSTYVIYFNKELAQNYNIDTDGLYDMVLSGNWTFDEMLQISTGIYSDLNNNGVEDNGDLYGFGLQVTSATDGFWSAFNIKNTEVLEDGNITYSLDLDKLSTIVTKLNNFLWSQTGTVALSENSTYAKGDVFELTNQFANDQLIFVTDLLYRTSTSTLRDMESDFGVLPYPKYDTEQESYFSFVHDQMTIFGVPATVSAEDLDMVGAFLEVMASEGQNTVMPTYYNKVLTTRNIRDPESVKMLDIILSGVSNDRIWFYNSSVGRINNILLREQVWYNKNEVSSVYRKNYGEVNNMLMTIKDSYEKYSGN